jgi:GAF domain-containing protein
MRQAWEGLTGAQQDILRSIGEAFRRDNELADALARLSEVGQALVSLEASSGELERLLQQVVESAQAVLGADVVTVYRYLQDRGEFLVPPVQVGELREPEVPKDKVFDDDVVVKILQRGSTLYSPNAQEEPQFAGPFEVERPERPEKRFVAREGIVSSAAVPLKVGAEAVGVMFVSYRSPQPFTDGQREVIELFANQAAVAIHNARLYRQASQRADTLARLSKVGQALVSLEASPGGELEQLLQQVVESAQAVLGADVVTVYRYLQDQGEFLVPPVQVGELREPEVPKDKVFDDDVVVKILQRGRALYSPDAQGEPQFAGPFEVERPERPEKRFVAREGIVSSAAVPLKVGAEAVGVMFVSYRSLQPFTNGQREVIELFANQAAVAIHNARQFDLISRQRDELRTISDIGTLLVSTLDVREVPKRLMQEVIPLFRVERASLWMVDEAASRVQFRFSLNREGQEDEIDAAMRAIPVDTFQLGGGIVGIVAQSGEPETVNNVREDPRWNDNVDEVTGFATNSILAVPLTHRGRTTGVIELINRIDDKPFTETDQGLMVALASIAAIALDNATLFYEVNRDLEQRYNELQHAHATLEEEQKRRIAAEKMKALGQAAASLAHKMNNLGGIIPVCVQKIREKVGANTGIEGDLYTIEQQAKRLLHTANDLLRPFAPSREGEFDVNTLVKDALQVTRPLLQDRIEVKFRGTKRLPKVRTTKLLGDVFIELITNAAKAISGEGKLEIETKLVDGRMIEISFTDTGCGVPKKKQAWIFESLGAFEPGSQEEEGAERPGTRFGLWWVRTFLQQQGGEVELRWSQVGRGSEFVVTHPVVN